MRLFHTTDAADSILRTGFRPSEGTYMFVGIQLSDGVFLSNYPVGPNEGAKGDQVLEVLLPDEVVLSEYAIEEEGQPVWEWYVPSSLVNSHGQVRLLTTDEIDEAWRRHHGLT
jgi:hypothetical protein